MTARLPLLAALALGFAARVTEAGVTVEVGQGVLPAMSADGRFVAFTTSHAAPGLSGPPGVFVADRLTGTVTPVSISLGGAILPAGLPDISADGRSVAFVSDQPDLVPNDTNGVRDAFVRDLQTGTITRVSVDSAGVQGNADTRPVKISADGRIVAFASAATNLVPGDTNGEPDVFIHDRDTGETVRVTVTSDGQQTGGLAGERRLGGLSGNGRVVAFASRAGDLVPGDTNTGVDVFVHDRDTGETTRVSVASDGSQATGVFGIFGSTNAAISFDGQVVAFASWAENLVPGDTNLLRDVFVRDRSAGTTTRVSLAYNGQQGNGFSGEFGFLAISGDGRYVAFRSEATNLVPEADTNAFGDVFVVERATGHIVRATVTPDGGVPDNGCPATSTPLTCSPLSMALSADGRFVAFDSLASNLVLDDPTGAGVFVRDLICGNHVLDPGEECDDGNATSGDGCELDCTETGPSTTSTTVTTTTSTTLPLDDFLCYRTTHTRGTPRFEPRPGVALVDRFADATYDVVAPQHLCTPASVNGGSIDQATTELRSYLLRHPGGSEARQTGLEVASGLANVVLDTTKPHLLLVPTVRPPASPSALRDHYKCYVVKLHRGAPRLPVNLEASVLDGFATAPRTFDVMRLRHLCTPVSKNGEGTTGSTRPLLCFRVTGRPGEAANLPVLGLGLTNQFGGEVANVVRESELCVSSTLALP